MVNDIRNYFDVVIETREGFRANCPRCDDKTRVFHWNQEKGVGCCFHAGCAWYYSSGGVTEFRLHAFFGGVPAYKAPVQIVQSKVTDVKLPKEFRQLAELDSKTFEEVYYYLKSRNLTRRAMNAAMLGYCKHGEMWGYIIIPVFENGEVVYWQGRRFKNRSRKFYNPESSQKNNLLYEMAAHEKPKGIVLVESAINALTLDDGEGKSSMKIFGLLGSSLSDNQLNKILAYERHAKELILALDPDAWQKSLNIAKRISGVIPVKIAKFPEGKDINNLGRSESWDIIRAAIPYRPEVHISVMEQIRV